jgi:hypothetical protein
MSETNAKIDLLHGRTDLNKIFKDEHPEILLLTVDEKQRLTFLTQTRQFLKERGLEIGDSEPINIQILCRDPHSTLRPLQLIFIRKSCKFTDPIKISSIFAI